METKFWKRNFFLLISLAIPAHRCPEFIDQSFFSKKLTILYIFNNKKKFKTEEKRRVISDFLIVQTLLQFFVKFWKWKWFFFYIPSNPPPIAVWNSLTSRSFQNNWCVCIFSKRKKKVTSLYRNIHPGDSWPYGVLPKFFFAVFYILLVTHLVSHRFTLGNPIISIPIMYLLRVI